MTTLNEAVVSHGNWAIFGNGQLKEIGSDKSYGICTQGATKRELLVLVQNINSLGKEALKQVLKGMVKPVSYRHVYELISETDPEWQVGDLLKNPHDFDLTLLQKGIIIW